jgi:two-component system OmpR family response regulator
MKSNRILLVDDEQHIVDVVVYLLEANGYRVTVAKDGDTGLVTFQNAAFDLVVLDLNLPGLDGIELFRRMRALQPRVPVVMLTSRDDEIDRVLGLELGADDYVTKPFSTRELAARVRAVLRRARPDAEPRPEARHECGPIQVDSDAFAVTCHGTRVPLTRAEFRFVECLVRHPARVFTRETLIDRLYDGEHVVTDRSVDACVKRIRRKFAALRPELDPIETVHGLGYKLNQELEQADA